MVFLETMYEVMELSQSPRLRDALRVRGLAVLGRGEYARRVYHTPTDDRFRRLVTERLLQKLRERLDVRLELLKFRLLFLIIGVEVFLRG